MITLYINNSYHYYTFLTPMPRPKRVVKLVGRSTSVLDVGVAKRFSPAGPS